MSDNFIINENLRKAYSDVYTTEVLSALSSLSHFNKEIKEAMTARIKRRAERQQQKKRISFLDPESFIPRTKIKVRDAREGKFEGAVIPKDLQRQWIQGTGPAAKPNATVESSIRNVAYALLSGADGWMFDGEDALGQIKTMSLDNQRNLKLSISKDPVFLKAAQIVAAEMNLWSMKFFGHSIVTDWMEQLNFTTKLFRARGLHLDDRHIRDADGVAVAASIVDMTLYVVNNYKELQKAGSSIVLYLPKIQTAGEAALWNDMLIALEEHLGLSIGSIKVYVLVEQLEATHQLMEIRAALGKHFVGYNTGRWDYINSVADAMAWDKSFINPNIEAITMTYGYMRNYEDRVRRAVNTPDSNGKFALWQGGMEPNIPVGARDLLSVALQYGNAFSQGFQAAALKPADSFGNDDVLYLMEDMATGEIRLSILWEWLHKGASLTEEDAETHMHAGDVFTARLF